MSTLLLFPSVIHRVPPSFDFKDRKKEIVEYVYDKKRKDSVGVKKTNIGGWQSHSFYDGNVEDPIIPFVLRSITDYFIREEIHNKRVTVKVINAWININRKGDYNNPHNHPGSDLSGVFYIKLPSNSGNIEFYSPHHYTYHHELMTYNPAFLDHTKSPLSYFLFCKEGEIILFPSSLEHSVMPSKVREDRISVAFNLEVRT
tara:strand:+ start:160 stop:762 length:603 start_codon:yes stop_codon:yes gene_type:complete